jgi:xanthine dehydrogenase accessory factor
MNDETSILVLGLDELASAIARKLYLASYAVAIHQATPPQTIRRRMAFSDAWTDGTCAFEGVEARRADRTTDVVAALQSGAFIPVLWHPIEEITSRWPWDIIIDARARNTAAPEKLIHLADLTIGLGRGFCAGEHCDVVIDIGARDPGAVLRHGSIQRQDSAEDARFSDGRIIVAPHHGVFQGAKRLCEPIVKGEIIGCVGATEIVAPASGRVRGLARDIMAVARGADIAEVVTSPTAEFVGIARRDKLIARSVAFVIEMERAGHAPISLESFL